MANRRFNRGFNRTRGPRRQTEWLSLSAPTAFTGLGASSKIQYSTGLTAAEITKLPFTIVRTIGFAWIQVQVETDAVASGAFGAAVVSQRATTVGITALPDPVTESEADFWFLFEPWTAGLRAIAAAGGNDMPYMMRFESKAQRKIEEGEDIAFIMANASSSAAISFQIQLRVLIKLH